MKKLVMIRFFRQIRKNLLNEGKTTHYFKYAIGEIILVVIGILIALQINNWNELRKFNNLKTLYIQRLLNDLEQDQLSINKLIDQINKQQQVIVTIMDKIETDVELELLRRPFEDYFKDGWIMFDFTPNMDEYTDLSQSGNMSVFRNSKIASSIKYYYVSIENDLKAQNINKDWILPIDVKLISETSAFEFDPMTKELFQNNDPLIAIENLLNHKSLFKTNAAGHYWFNKSLQNRIVKTKMQANELVSILQMELDNNNR